MTIQLELKPFSEETLRAAAQQSTLPVEDYLHRLVESALHPSIIPAIPAKKSAGTPEEFSRNMRPLAQFSDQIPNPSRPDLVP
jgi:hypothetical protein